MALTSYPDRTSPVLRGKWLLDNILGADPPPPPANVDTSLDQGAGVAALGVLQVVGAIVGPQPERFVIAGQAALAGAAAAFNLPALGGASIWYWGPPGGE